MKRALLVLLAACGGGGEHRPDISRTGATELEYTLTAPIDPAAAKRTLQEAGLEVYWVELSPSGDLIVQVPLQRPDPAAQEAAIAAVRARFGAAIEKVAWAGNRLYLRSNTALPEADLRAALIGFEVTHIDAYPDPELGEIEITVSVAGPEVRYERAIEARLPVTSPPVTVESVGPQKR